MKISSASKKVLASALSAAMVVAFAPTVAFAAGSTHASVKGTTVLDGTVASYITTNSDNELITVCYTEALNGGSAEAALNAALNDADASAITLHQDVAGNFSAQQTVTLDLNGHTLTNEGAVEKAVTGSFAKASDTVTVSSGETLTVKGGTITATQGEDKDGKAVAGAGALKVVSGTFNGAVSADVQDVKAGTFNGTVTDSADGFTVKDATFAVSAEKGNAAAVVANNQTVTVSGTVSVKAEASEKDATATAIDGNVETTGEKAALTVSAATAGVEDSTAPNATGVTGNLSVAKKTSAEVSAAAKDDEATAIAVAGDFSGSATLTATVAGAYDVANAIAIGSKAQDDSKAITGGKYTGAIKVASSTDAKKFITAGTFTANPKPYINATNYTVVDDGTYYTVFAKSAAAIDTTGLSTWISDSDGAIAAAVADVVADVTDGKDVSNVKYADGKTAADLKAAIAAGTIGYDATATKYNAKTASEADKANYAAIEAMVKGKKSAIADNTTFTFTVAVTNGKTGSKKVTYAYLTGLGNGDRGVARTVALKAADDVTKASVAANGYGIATAVDGKAADAPLSADRAGNLTHEVATTGMFSVYALSLNEVSKDDDKPAAEKATQGIDVAKKSKTVKLAKKASKTKKAASFNMGVSAETAVTTAKKSGSSKITVKGGKVTLKKGVKKGTYTAKVTVKAAADDQYMAATKTVTVKFVVKK